MKFFNKLRLFGLLMLTILSFSLHAQTIQLGSGTGTTNFIPNQYNYNYSYSQTIYTAAELVAGGAAGIPSTITKIRYKPTSSVSTTQWKNWTVYIGNTTQAGFTGGYNWTPVSSMTNVFSGDLPLATTVANTWMEITLTTPFAWDGTSNIVVAIDENTNAYGNNPNWASYTLAPSTGNKGIYFYSDGTNPDPNAPPTSGSNSGTSNAVAQIQFDGIFTPPCTGTPSAGTVPATAAICGGLPYTLVATGTTTGVYGLTGQWEFRTPAGSGTWQTLAGATTATYTVATMPTTPTDYRYILTCGTNSDTSNTLTTTINTFNQCYCTPGSANSSYYIDSFATSGATANIINGSTGYSVGGYGNYTGQTVSQNRGSTVNFYRKCGGTSTYSTKVWVDWNQNGVLDDAGEVVYSSSAYANAQSGSFTVPITALPGATRMRVGISYNSSASGPSSPCLTTSDGEYEDYTFMVTTPTGCLAPTGIVAYNFTNDAASIRWTPFPLGDPYATFDYEVRASGAAGSGAAGLSASGNAVVDTFANLMGLAAGTPYSVYVRTNCTGSTQSGWTSAVTFTLPTYVPVAVSGFSADVIANGVGPALSSTTNDVDGVNYALVAQDFKASPTGSSPTKYLPNGGKITSGSKWYQLANYSGNNSLRLQGVATTGTLHFLAPKQATTVYVMGISGSAASSVSAQVWFNDNTSQTFTGLSYPDWFASTGNIVVSQIGRINKNTNALEAGAGPQLFENTLAISAANQSKQIDSIVFTNSAAGVMNVLGVSIVPNYTQSCGMPMSLSASNVTATGANIAWAGNGASTSYQLSYGLQGTTAGSGTISTITGTTSLLNTLTPNTAYQVFVRSVCAGSTYSDWIGPVNIHTPMLPCTGTPSAGTVPVTMAVCPTQPINLVATGVTTGFVGLTGQWQYRTPAGSGAWMDLTGATTETYTVSSAPASATDYRYTLTCGTNTGVSDTLTTTINPPTQCYCIPASSNANRYIDSFATSGGSTTITNGSTGYSAGGYGNFTSQTVTQDLGSTVNFFAKYVGGTFGTTIWVDWNQNGVLDDPGELVYSSPGYLSAQSGLVTVPGTALPGATRMRVGISFNTSTGPADPCSATNDGEYEDYTFVVTVPSCAVPSALTSSNVTTSTATISWTAATPAPAGGYEYYQSTTNTAPTAATVATGSVAAGIVSEDVALLTSNTTYYIWVRSVCSSNNKSNWTLPTTFTTSCTSTTIPYTAPLAAATPPAMPSCMGTETIAGNTWDVINNPGYGFTANTITYTYNTSSAANSWFYTQGLELTAGVSYRLSYRYGSATYTEKLQVKYGTAASSASMTTLLADYPSVTNSTPNDATIDFTPNTTGVYYIGFKAYSVTNQYYLFVDNIAVDLSPTCLSPNNLSSNATASSASFSWDAPVAAPASGYEYYYNTSATAPISTTTPSGSTLAGVTTATSGVLNPNTTYNLWVRSVCSSLDKSAWSSVLTFTTPCVSTSIPYLAPIQAVTVPANPSCMPTEVITGNAWKTSGSGSGFSGKKLTYPYNSSQAANSWIYTQGLDLTAGVSYQLSYRYGNNGGTTYPEKLKVAYGTAASSSSMTGQLANHANIVNSSTPIKNIVDFTPTITGIYYIGLNAYSDADMNQLYVDSIYVIPTPCAAPIIVNLGNDTTVCGATTLSLDAGNAGSTFLWNNATTAQTLTVTTAGTYSVNVTNGICSTSDTIVVGFGSLPIVDLGNDTTICVGQTLSLDAGNTGATYLWNDNSTNQTLDVTTTGTYSVMVTDGLCSANDTVVVDVTPLPVVDLGMDTTICSGQPLILDAGNAGATYLWNDNSTNQTLDVSAAGTYSVIVSNGNCSATDSIVVSTVPLPTGDSIAYTMTDCSFGFSVANAQNADTYSWNFGDGTAMGTGATPSHTYASSGSYDIVLTMKNMCGDSLVLTRTVSCIGVGIKNIDLSKDALKLYPNPTSDKITIENTSNLNMEYITVFNVLGQVVYQSVPQSAVKHQMNVSNLASGLYTVRIQTNEGMVVRKFEILK